MMMQRVHHMQRMHHMQRVQRVQRMQLGADGVNAGLLIAALTATALAANAAAMPTLLTTTSEQQRPASTHQPHDAPRASHAARS